MRFASYSVVSLLALVVIDIGALARTVTRDQWAKSTSWGDQRLHYWGNTTSSWFPQHAWQVLRELQKSPNLKVYYYNDGSFPNTVGILQALASKSGEAIPSTTSPSSGWTRPHSRPNCREKSSNRDSSPWARTSRPSLHGRKPRRSRTA